MNVRALLLGLAAGAAVAAGACDGDAGGPATTYDAAVVAPDWCDLAPVVTWDNFGQGFLVENCQPCHASASRARHDAPEEVVFDTLADVATHRERILVNATGDDPAMPPAGGVSLEDRALLEVWLECGMD